MFHNANRFLNTSIAVLVVFSLLFGFVSPAFSEGEVPDDAPPMVTPGSGGEDSPQNLEQALSDGGAVVANAGMLSPLASQSDLDDSCIPDPYFYGSFCVGGICGYDTITEALNNWGMYKGKGFIYLEGTYAGSESITINGAPGYNPEFQTLTGIIWDHSYENPTLNGNLTIENLAKGFTLREFNINGEVTFANNKGLIMLQNMTLDQETNDGYGLKINNHAGPVTLNQVRVINTLNNGVLINNAYPGGAATGTVTVSNLTILNTAGDPGVLSPSYGGLLIRSNSPITINGLFIKDTAGGGALILPGKSPVTIKNGYIGFSRDLVATTTYKGFGLKIAGGDDPAGTITLDNLRMYDNQSDGVLIGNAGVLKLNNVFSSGNYEGYGLHLGDTDNPDTAKSLTITNSQFNWNGVGGALVEMRGPVSITYTEFSGNWGDEATGLYLNNSAASGAAVVLSDVSANDNRLNGLEITTSGNATLTTIQAFHNGATGASINASAGLGNVTLTNSIFNDNGEGGLAITAQKNITLKLVEASNNVEFGAKLNNASGTGNVTLQGTGTSGNNFHKNGTAGLTILSNGTVSITNISTDGNGEYGVSIDNSRGRGGVSILAASPYWLNAFTFSQNGNGLTIFSLGNIKLVNVAAWQNARTGVELDNCRHNGGCTGFGSVTISSLGTSTVNSFNDNSSRGLVVHSFGNISLNNVEASRNEDIESICITSKQILLAKPAWEIFLSKTSPGGMYPKIEKVELM